MNARRHLVAALSEDSLGGIATLQDVTHAEQLADAYRAEILAEVEAQLATMTTDADQQTEAMENEGADSASLMYAQHIGLRRACDAVRRLAGEEATAAAATATPDFFQPGHTYARQHHASTVRFLVRNIDTSPDGSYRVAFGWRIEDGDVSWSPSDSDDMDGWADVTEAGDL